MSPVLEQSMSALQAANEFRIGRAAIKREIFKLGFREGREAVIDIIRDPGELWDNARLSYVLRMPDKSGDGFVRRVTRVLSLNGLPVTVDYRLGKLTDRQRELLVTAISECGRKR